MKEFVFVFNNDDEEVEIEGLELTARPSLAVKAADYDEALDKLAAHFKADREDYEGDIELGEISVLVPKRIR